MRNFGRNRRRSSWDINPEIIWQSCFPEEKSASRPEKTEEIEKAESGTIYFSPFSSSATETRQKETGLAQK